LIFPHLIPFLREWPFAPVPPTLFLHSSPPRWFFHQEVFFRVDKLQTVLRRISFPVKRLQAHAGHVLRLAWLRVTTPFVPSPRFLCEWTLVLALNPVPFPGPSATYADAGAGGPLWTLRGPPKLPTTGRLGFRHFFFFVIGLYSPYPPSHLSGGVF